MFMNQALVLLGTLFTLFVLLFLFQKPRKPLFSLEVIHLQKMFLRFSFHKPLRIWLKYQLEYSENEDSWEIHGNMVIRKNGEVDWADKVILRFNSDPNNQKRSLLEKGSFYGLSSWQGSTSSGKVRDTVMLGRVASMNTLDRWEIEIFLEAKENTKPKKLLLYLSK